MQQRTSTGSPESTVVFKENRANLGESSVGHGWCLYISSWILRRSGDLRIWRQKKDASVGSRAMKWSEELSPGTRVMVVGIRVAWLIARVCWWMILDPNFVGGWFHLDHWVRKRHQWQGRHLRWMVPTAAQTEFSVWLRSPFSSLSQ